MDETHFKTGEIAALFSRHDYKDNHDVVGNH